MRVAVAGPGDVAKYLVEELLAASHEVVVLTRSSKPWFAALGIPVRITDYSVESLTNAINDCEALVSTVQDRTMGKVTKHLAMLKACTESPKCKRFIPAEWVGNIDDFPDQPGFYPHNHVPTRQALAEQKEVMYTLLCPGWFSDYFVPPTSRYIKDIGSFHPVDWAAGTMTIPGTGDEKITFTSARDAAKAVAQLVDKDNWDTVTYVSGETSSWNQVREVLAKHGKNLVVKYRSEAIIQNDVQNGSQNECLLGQFEMWSVSGGAFVPQGTMANQKQKFFKDVPFRTVEKIVELADKDSTIIV